MTRKNPEFEYSVFGRVDLKSLYNDWMEETDLDGYEEPLEGWQLKYSYVFENDICALLFENSTDNMTSFYRILYFKGEYEQFELIRKIRFQETDCYRVDAIGINQEFSAQFVCRSNDTIKQDIYYDQFEYMKTPVENRSNLVNVVLEQSDKKFAVLDGMTVLFVAVPDSGWIGFSDDDPHDFLFKIDCADLDEDDDFDENHVENPVTHNGDDYEDIDGDDGDDDTKCHVKAHSSASTKKAAAEELHELIGLESIKEKVDQIVAFARVQKIAKDHGKDVEGINLNMSFLGNPGTAKTTVARLFARIMKENGILSKGDLIEVGRADLVAKYTGQTAIKVKGLFEKAKGNVLFIDEAYSLVDGWENEYGDEAIATIVQEMENNRDDMIVIFAGYPEKMEAFLSRNPGLRSRVPFVVEFQDYSAEELLEIAKMEAKRRGYSISHAAEKKIYDICTSAKNMEEFGNGRFSRNLVESAIMKAASRVLNAKTADSDLDAFFCLEDCDFTRPGNMKKDKTTKVIGFSAA